MACFRWETVEEGENSKVTGKVTDRTSCSLFWHEGEGPELVKSLGLYSAPVEIVVLFLGFFKNQNIILQNIFFSF